MAIAYFGSASAQYSGTATPVIPTPSSIPAGALIVASIGGFFGTATLSLSGGGWTQLDGGMSNTGSHWIFAKVAAGGEGSITATSDGSGCFGAASVLVFTGVDTSSPVIAHSGTRWGGVAHSTVTSPSVNNTGTSSACAVFVGNFYNGGAGHGQATPTNMSIGVVSGDDSTTGSSFGFYRLNTPTGSQSYSTASTDAHTNWYGGDGLLFLAPGVTAVNASAGVATATAAGLSATTTLAASPSPGSASATSVARDATTTQVVSTNAGKAVASAAGYGTTITDTASPTAGVAAATASGLGAAPTGTLSVTAGLATVEAVAYSVAPTDVSVSAGRALSHTSAFNTPIGIYAGTASVTASVEDATGQIAQSASAGIVEVVGAAYGRLAEVEATTNAGVAEVEGVAKDTGIASSSNTPVGVVEVVAEGIAVAPGIGSGLPIPAYSDASAYDVSVLTTGGSSANVRALRVRAIERTYRIPRENRTIVIGRS